jgi:hypothetical protein
MVRHRLKDEHAGGPGLGIVESRKRMWLDVDGSIVSQRPTASRSDRGSSTEGQPVLLEQRQAQHGAVAEGSQGHKIIAPPTWGPLSPLTPRFGVDCFELFSQLHPQLSWETDLMGPTDVETDMFELLAMSPRGSQSYVVPEIPITAWGPEDVLLPPGTAKSCHALVDMMNSAAWDVNLDATFQPAAAWQWIRHQWLSA